MPTDLPPQQPKPPAKRRPWALPFAITGPALGVLIGYELLRPQFGHGATDWFIVGVGGVGLLIAIVYRLIYR